MPFPPEIYLIGAQKSGTTSLAYLLSQHPDICLSHPKETHFFSYHWEKKKLGWYQQRFDKRENAICIDASTTYSMAPLTLQNQLGNKQYFRDIPNRIYSLNPQARFIYIMRDPVERTYSGYWHTFSQGLETRQFGKALKEDYFYLDISDYFGQLELWLKLFPLESFCFLLFEDLKKDPTQVAKKCFNFIGVNPEKTQINLKEARNKSVHYNFVGRRLNYFFKPLHRSGMIKAIPFSIRKFFPIRRLLAEATVDSNKVIPKMSEEERLFLQEYFLDKNPKLEDITGLSLNQWQSHSINISSRT